MRRLSLPAFLVTLLFAVPAMSAGPALKDVLIKDVPHVRQKPDFCGEACVEMWTTYLKQPVSQDDAFNVSGVKPIDGRGCVTRDMVAALKALNFSPGETWYTFPAADAAKNLDAQFAALHADLARGVPSIVCMHYDDKPNTTEHFRLVLGYDAAKDEVIYHEPAVDNAPYRHMPRATFLKLWPLASGDRNACVVRMRLDLPNGAKVKAPAKQQGFTSADYAQHIMKLREKAPKGFSYMIQKPFVIVSDQDAATMQAHAERTVKWAVDKLKAEYFAKDPTDILDVWLFKDADSYTKNVQAIFGDAPSTPYGYYSPTDKALIMNISTGGGTLVHEIVHPFMAANFAKCPPWFNEGMGSLYEQCGERNGHIIGYTNWRLPGLQKAIKAGTVPAFETLFAMDHLTFYTKDKGTNYGQSRYLCYYLQEKGLLQKYYKEFTASAKDDPTGVNSLKKVLNTDDLETFKKNWEAWVLTLRFP